MLSASLNKTFPSFHVKLRFSLAGTKKKKMADWSATVIKMVVRSIPHCGRKEGRKDTQAEIRKDKEGKEYFI